MVPSLCLRKCVHSFYLIIYYSAYSSHCRSYHYVRSNAPVITAFSYRWIPFHRCIGMQQNDTVNANKSWVRVHGHRCQPSRIRRDSPAFSTDVPRPAKWDRCPAFLENCIIFFFSADYFTFLPCNATKWRTSNKARSILCTPTDAVYISRVAAAIMQRLFIF